MSFHLHGGEIVALCGENGAGKSTLMKVMSGVIPAGDYAGEILLEDRPLAFQRMRDSEHAGIAIIHQELSIVGELTLEENIFLGSEPHRLGWLRRRKMREATTRLLKRLGLDLDPSTLAQDLSVSQQQLIEIAKALRKQPRFLILDEPTSALAEAEIHRLLDILRGLRSEGVGCALISHKLDEVFSIADRIVVLRDGRTVATYEAKASTPAQVIRDMVGREIQDLYPPRRKVSQGSPRLQVRGLTNDWFRGLDLEVHGGEIVGIAGLMGSGRSEFLLSLFGAAPSATTMDLRIDGRPARVRNPRDAARSGLALVSEDRKRLGLSLDHSLLENASLTALSLKRWSRAGWIAEQNLHQEVSAVLDHLKTKRSQDQLAVRTLSGGNQQKVVLAKWLMAEPRVLFLDEPTRGIDVGARSEFYSRIRELADKGLAVVVVSSELPEVMGLADRVLVMRDRRWVAEFTSETCRAEAVMAAATGQTALEAGA